MASENVFVLHSPFMTILLFHPVDPSIHPLESVRCARGEDTVRAQEQGGAGDGGEEWDRAERPAKQFLSGHRNAWSCYSLRTLWRDTVNQWPRVGWG